MLQLTNSVDFMLINFHNEKAKMGYISTLNNLSLRLQNFEVTLKKIILVGDFNLFLNSKLDAKGGKPAIKKNPWLNLFN